MDVLCTGNPWPSIRTTPVMTVVQDLIAVLRDEQIPDHEAHTALRRAVRLLSVVAEVNRLRARPEPPRQGPHVEPIPWIPSKRERAADTQSLRLRTDGCSDHPTR